MSHELRGPLTSIYGFAETLLREDVLFGEEERRTFLGYIASESERLTAIVDRLLNVARLDTGDLQVKLAPTDVAGGRHRGRGAVEGATANGHRFVLDLPGSRSRPRPTATSCARSSRACVDNAVKYSPGGRHRHRRCAPRETTPSRSRVEDEGVGIPQAEQERIFRKFYRGGDASSRHRLGLFLAQGLVTAMGGRIRVESEEGRDRSSRSSCRRAREIREERRRV